MATTEVIAEQNDPTRSPPFGPGSWHAILCSCQVPVCRVPRDRPSSTKCTGGTRPCKVHHLVYEAGCPHFSCSLQQHDPNIQSPVPAGAGLNASLDAL